jgi:hypothetical protein
MKIKYIAFYLFFIGISVIGMWLKILQTQTPTEGETEFSFHLFAEFLMATVCIVGGYLQLLKARYAKPISFVGLSMVIYSVLNAAGYYGERGVTAMMVMFICLFITSVIALVLILVDKKSEIC